MKKYLMILFISFSVTTLATQTWTPVSKEKSEYNAIIMKIARINNQFTALGGFRSSGRQVAIFQLLKNIGTPISYKIMKELIARGDLDKKYLNNS